MNKLLILISIILLLSCNSEPKEVYGCTDSNAYNFNSTANIFDNSCCYISGCMDSISCNFNSEACFQSECIFADEHYNCQGDCIEQIDQCGVCDDDPYNDCSQDCSGEWGGENICGCSDFLACNFDENVTISSNYDCLYGGWEFFNGECNLSILEQIGNINLCNENSTDYNATIVSDSILTFINGYYPELFQYEPFIDINNNGSFDNDIDVIIKDLNNNNQWDSFENSQYNPNGQLCPD